MMVQHVADLSQALAAVIAAFRRPVRGDTQILCGHKLVWASYDNGRTLVCDLPQSKLRELQRYHQLRRAELAS